MRRAPGLLLAVAVTAALTGCAAPAPAPTGSPPSSPDPAAPSSAPVQAGVSPGGVTTALSAPASSTEEEYYQACRAARVWMAAQPGDRHTQVEPYLAMVQASPNGDDGTWQTPWRVLTPERQAAVIVAATSAADGRCDE